MPNNSENKHIDSSKYSNKYLRWLLLAAGTISVFLGLLGIILPLLPTTPFLLLGAACYAKSSEKFYKWLLNNRIFGSYIRNYREGKGIPVRIKLTALIFLWTTIMVTVLFFIPGIPVKILLIIIASGVTVHILKLPSSK